MLRRIASSGLRPSSFSYDLGLHAAGVTAVAVHALVGGLVLGEHDLAGVDDDDVVAGVDVRGEDRLVLAAQDAGGFGAHATEHQAIGIDDVPGAGDLACFRAVSRHFRTFRTWDWPPRRCVAREP